MGAAYRREHRSGRCQRSRSGRRRRRSGRWFWHCGRRGRRSAHGWPLWPRRRGRRLWCWRVILRLHQLASERGRRRRHGAARGALALGGHLEVAHPLDGLCFGAGLELGCRLLALDLGDHLQLFVRARDGRSSERKPRSLECLHIHGLVHGEHRHAAGIKVEHAETFVKCRGEDASTHLVEPATKDDLTRGTLVDLCLGTAAETANALLDRRHLAPTCGRRRRFCRRGRAKNLAVPK